VYVQWVVLGACLMWLISSEQSEHVVAVSAVCPLVALC
jgi:hypothetical protein